MRTVRFTAVVALVLLTVSSAVAADETFGQKILSAAAGSAGSKGAEFAVKFVSGWIYNISCKPEQQNDGGSKALCGALGSLSGKSEEEWKAKIEQRLGEISGKLDTLEAGQSRIEVAIAQQHAAMDAQFKQVPSRVRATAILTTIDNFWGLFVHEVKNPKSEMNKTDLEKFAAGVMRSDLHNQLGELNSLLSHPIDNAPPLLAVPFLDFRRTWSQGAPPEAFPGMKTYDYAENKFAYYRAEQQKGMIVYLWAAEIVQSDCELRGDAKCAALPMTSTAFNRQYERFTREQVAAFGAAANGMLLAYSRPDIGSPQFLVRNPIEETILGRINYLTATYLDDARGAWGEIISTAGDPWSGQLKLECGGQSATVAPELTYTIPVDAQHYGSTVDWWTSRAHNGTYDEVHFSPQWRVLHYKLESAGIGPCRVDPQLPGVGDRLPWSSPNSEVVSVTKDGTTAPFGFFYGIERAGGTYALASGRNWYTGNPQSGSRSGPATRAEDEFKWLASPDHAEGLWAGFLAYGRVEHTLGQSLLPTQEAKISYYFHVYDRKQIFFPDGGPVRLHLIPTNECDRLCRPGETAQQAVMDYDIEDNPFEKGKLTAVVAAFFDTKEGYDGAIFDRARNGIYIDGSYGDTNDRKTKRVDGDLAAPVRVSPGQGYHLEYFFDFDLLTHTKRLDASSYRFVGKITPISLFVTR